MIEVLFLLATGRLIKNKEYSLVFALIYAGMIVFFSFLFSAGTPSGTFFNMLLLGVVNFVFAYVYYLALLRLQDSLIVGILASVVGALIVFLAPGFLLAILNPPPA